MSIAVKPHTPAAQRQSQQRRGAAIPPHAVYFDWHVDLRAGGPPGYLANLRRGIDLTGLADSVSFILNENRATQLAEQSAPSVTKGPLLQRTDGNPSRKKASDKLSQKYRDHAAFLARHDWFHVPPEKLRQLDPQARNTVHVHTTIDAIKVHNALTRHGLRHRTKLILTSHSPEIPSKEWAEQALAEGASRKAVELYYNNYREVDYLAFHASDILMFPSRAAMEPYYSTMPDFRRLFGQKDTRFVETGAEEMPIGRSSEDVRAELRLDTNNFVCCYIGRHNRVKGYDVLSAVGLTLLQDCPDIAFLIGGRAGPLPPVEHERWIEYGWTKMPGDLVNASDVFILPNQQTYFDLIMLEVLSTGRMVIASRTGGNKHFEELSDGVILYDTPTELLQAILRVRAMDAEERRRRGGANRSLYQERFSLQPFARNYVAAIEAIHRDYRLPDRRNPSTPVAAPARVAKAAKDQPDVSVIVPVYNVDKYLRECLASIAGQTLKNIEVILVNDGSTDRSPEIIAEFVARDPRFRCVERPNGGLSAARNSGLDEAKGRFIAFVDSDDYMAPEMLERLLDACTQCGTKLAVCGVTHLDPSRGKKVHTSFLEDEQVYPHWENGCIRISLQTVTSVYPSAWNKLYHASLFEGVRYDAGLYYEDHPVFYKIFLTQEKFAFVNEPLYVHRESGVGRITRDGSRRTMDVLIVIDIIESILRAKYSLQDARLTMAKIIIRLVWERHWVIADPAIRFLLMENAVMRFEAWKLTRDEIRRNQDRITENDFVDQIYQFAGESGEWSTPYKRLTSLDASVDVADWSEEVNASEYPMVDYQPEQAFILVHPQPACMTIAQVTGLGFFGAGSICLSACTENELAGPVEFRVFVAPFSVLDRRRFEQEDNAVWSARSEWITLNPMESRDIELRIPSGSPTMAVYFCTRVPEGGSTHYAWTRVRSIRVLQEPTNDDD